MTSADAQGGDVVPGIFVCTVGCNLPLFLTEYLSPTTELNRWLTIYRPILDDYVVLIPSPAENRRGGGYDELLHQGHLRSFHVTYGSLLWEGGGVGIV